jgi:hypothetical protein
VPSGEYPNHWRPHELNMPLARISLRRGKSAAYRAAILDGIYAALRETFDVPEDDRFMLVTQHDADEFDYSPALPGHRAAICCCFTGSRMAKCSSHTCRLVRRVTGRVDRAMWPSHSSIHSTPMCMHLTNLEEMSRLPNDCQDLMPGNSRHHSNRFPVRIPEPRTTAPCHC